MKNTLRLAGLLAALSLTVFAFAGDDKKAADCKDGKEASACCKADKKDACCKADKKDADKTPEKK